ncbi:protein BIG GRAIN 1-like E [Impatiens glandulifera]|uniref:protein BIG GRAIN 1-like E n=1 Tax=Impatiens glandulifera TaxID=253017 RepID=UPI001FB12F04|nr:protein BIG GRAIN 1-like E [Impatiens glandulifera]
MAPYDQKNMFLKHPFHLRNGSDELDVFQATQYFAGEEKPSPGEVRPIVSSQKERARELDQKQGIRRIGRMSLDLPTNIRNSSISNSSLADDDYDDQFHMIMDKKQPRTPARRIASFFSSLFNQTSNQRKSTKNSKVSKERRSSMSNLRDISSNNHDSKSIYSSSSSETPKKGGYINNNMRRINNFDQNKQMAPISTSLPSKIIMPATSTIICGESKVFEYANWLDEKFKVDYAKGLPEKEKKNPCQEVGGELLKSKFNKVEDAVHRDEVDDGGESDSSSDLFEISGL